MNLQPALYLIPSPLNPEAPSILSLETYEIVDQLDYFAAERARTARRLIKVWFPEKDISSLEIVEWDKHADIQPFHKWLEPVKKAGPWVSSPRRDARGWQIPDQDWWQKRTVWA